MDDASGPSNQNQVPQSAPADLPSTQPHPQPPPTPPLPVRTSSSSLAATELPQTTTTAQPLSSATSSISSASKQPVATQRNRRGILSRQHSAQSSSHVSSHQTPDTESSLSPSSSTSRLAAENTDNDDPIHLSSDSNDMPRRFPSSSSAAARSQHPAFNPNASLESVVMFNRASPLTSATSSLSGTKSSPDPYHRTLHRPIPKAFIDSSKTRIASNASSSSSRVSLHSAEVSDTNDAASHLSRAKSISSVSSVTSTSSMEAAPFRAPPMGNIRMGYVGTGRNANIPARVPAAFVDVVGVPQRISSQGVLDTDTPKRILSRRPSADTESSDGFVSAADAAAAQAQAQAQVEVEEPEASASSLLTESQQLPPRIKGHVPKLPSDTWQYRNAPGTGTRLGGRPLPGSSRNLAELRQRAANSMQPNQIDGGSASPSQDTNLSRLSTAQNPSLSSKRPAQALRSKLAKSASRLGLKPLSIIPGATGPSPRGVAEFADSASTTSEELDVQQDLISSATGAALEDPRQYARALATGLLVPSPLSARDVPALGGGGQAQRTSLVTNAPLIVPKLSPSIDAVPPGGPGGGVFPFGIGSSPRLTATRIAEDHRPVQLQSNSSPRSARHTSLSPPSTPHATGAVRFQWSTGNGTPSGDGSPYNRSQMPSPSPAELVRMEAQAGVATLPAEGSGSTPGPTPLAESKQHDQQSPSRPSHANGNPLASLIPPRPIFRRTRTNESMRSKNSDSSIGKDRKKQQPTKKVVGSVAETSQADLQALQAYTMTPTSTAHVDVPVSRPVSLASIGSDGLSLGAEAPMGLNSPDGSPGRLRPESIPQASVTSAPRFPPFPMQRMESTATATSKAISDTSDMIPPIPFKAPPKEVAGRVSASNLKFEGIESPRISQSNDIDCPSTVGLQAPQNNRGEGLGSIAERSSDGAESAQPSEHKSTTVDAPPTPVAAAQEPAPSAQANPAVKPSEVDTPPVKPKPSSLARPAAKPRNKEDFEFGDVLGEGSYSTVIMAWDLLSNPAAIGNGPRPKATVTPAAAMAGESTSDAWIRDNMKAYAIKVLDKIHILKERKQKYVGVEKEALSLLIRHPGVVTLYWTFQDAESLYFVLELAGKGELLTYIKKLGSFDEATTRFYAAQVCETIAGMHKAGVIHRDIKPENILLDNNMRVKITDFGSAKIVPSAERRAAAADSGDVKKVQELQEKDTKERSRASSFVGTAEYVSPELLTEKAASEASDFWAFGCVLFQMLAGRPAFKANSEYQTFQKIIKRDIDFPVQLSETARDLLDRLLVLDPAERLGSGPNGVEEIKSHPFFKGMSWGDELWKMPVPEMKTGLQGPPPIKEPIRGEPPSMGDIFGSDNYVQDDDGLSQESLLDDDVRGGGEEEMVRFPSSAQTGDDQSSDGESEGRASEDSSPPASLQSGHADADDDASSTSDSHQPAPRRRGMSAGASTSERMGPGKRASVLFRMAASVTGQDKSATTTTSRSRGQRGHSSSISGSGGSSSRLSVLPALKSPSTSQSSSSNNVSSLAHPFQPVSKGMYLNWAALLLPQESILYASPVIHRKTGTANLQSKRRMLILTDFPRLLCVKEDTDLLKVKSEILLSPPGGGTPMTRGSSSGGMMEGTHSTPQMAGSNAISTIVSASDAHGRPPPPPTRETRRDSVPTSLLKSHPTGANVMISVEQKSTRTFMIHTASRGYLYEESTTAGNGDVGHWVRSIKNAQTRVKKG
ncbi:unnamed protein product [Sympodiomycopsis kandeliae]